MKAREVMMMRLSKTWATSEPDMISSLAQYLYSFYTFLRLNDLTTSLGWGIGIDRNNGEIYLVVMEIDSEGEDDDRGVTDLSPHDFKTDLDLNLKDETGEDSNDGLSEEEIDPDLRGGKDDD